MNEHADNLRKKGLLHEKLLRKLWETAYQKEAKEKEAAQQELTDGGCQLLTDLRAQNKPRNWGKHKGGKREAQTWALGPLGPWVHLGPAPSWALDPLGPKAPENENKKNDPENKHTYPLVFSRLDPFGAILY